MKCESIHIAGVCLKVESATTTKELLEDSSLDRLEICLSPLPWPHSQLLCGAAVTKIREKEHSHDGFAQRSPHETNPEHVAGTRFGETGASRR
jgi:hypothetical protein